MSLGLSGDFWLGSSLYRCYCYPLLSADVTVYRIGENPAIRMATERSAAGSLYKTVLVRRIQKSQDSNDGEIPKSNIWFSANLKMKSAFKKVSFTSV